MAHSCNIATQRAEGRKTEVQSQTIKKKKKKKTMLVEWLKW
jgi:hypothetical protein